MKGIVKLREEAHNRALNFRTIENVICRPKFARLWCDSTEKEQQEVTNIIEKGHRRKLYSWIRNHPSLDLSEKPIVQLRRIGRQVGVKYYARLKHSELVAAIIQKENKYESVQGP